MKRILIIALFSIATLCCALAAELDLPLQSMTNVSSMVGGGSSLSSDVYQPFANEMPSEVHSAFGPRRVVMDEDDDDEPIGGDFEDPGNPMPVGGSMIFLLFALMAAGVIAWKNRKKKEA